MNSSPSHSPAVNKLPLPPLWKGGDSDTRKDQTKKIAVSGHSHGAKTALLAGLTDTRISLINDNASGAGGSALSRYVAGKGETLENIVTQFPYWFGPELQKFIGKEEALPFDQHTLLACLAPRPVLLTYALDDLWSNPPGMVLAAEAARAVLMDFIGVHWQGKQSTLPYNQHFYGNIN